MPAYLQPRRTTRPRERIIALAAVVAVQVALGLALLVGLRVQMREQVADVQRLIDIALVQPPPPIVPTKPPPKRARSKEAAPKAEPKPIGGSPGPEPAHAPPSVAPIVPMPAKVAPSGGGIGSGPAAGAGSGGGTGGAGYGDSGDGGTEIEQIAGAIVPSDYPRRLREAGIGGTVEFSFMVGVNGRVTRCSVTRSSGVPELDALTCRLIQQRFLYRPGTDRFGRPVPEVVDGEHEWVSRRRY